MRDICRQDCDSEAVGGRSRGFSAQFRPLITQALIHTSSLGTELQKVYCGAHILPKWYVCTLQEYIFSKNYMVTGVYMFSFKRMLWSAKEIFEALVDQFQIPRPIFLHGLCPSGNDYPNFCSLHINWRTFTHVLASCYIFVHTFAYFGIWFYFVTDVFI